MPLRTKFKCDAPIAHIARELGETAEYGSGIHSITTSFESC